MKDIIVIGAGSFGREVAQLIKEININRSQWNFLGFIDETAEKQNTIINNDIVLGDLDWFKKKLRDKTWAVCAIGNPKDKYALINKITGYDIKFANLIHPDVRVNEFVEIGVGNIICCNAFVSVNTKLGNHISINPGCGIGHDAIIGDYSTLYWNVTLSGNVRLGNGCEIGSKATILPKRNIGNWSIIGAGAVVVKDISDNCTAVGVPAKPIKTLECK